MPTLLGWNPSIRAIVVVLGLAICCSSDFAQSDGVSIQGTVTPATGVVIPAAGVHFVNVATNVAADTKPSSVGFYQAPALLTGHYRVTVTAPGMKTYVTAIELLLAQNAVINPIMPAGAVTQQVVVSGNAVQFITTDDGSVTDDSSVTSEFPPSSRRK